MLPVVKMPDVEMFVAVWLRGVLPSRPESVASGVIVGMSVPEALPARLVVVRRDGGPRANLVNETARLGINVWAAEDQDATDLARLVEALLLSLSGHPPVITSESISGISPVADVKPRRYFTIELTVRGDAA